MDDNVEYWVREGRKMSITAEQRRKTLNLERGESASDSVDNSVSQKSVVMTEEKRSIIIGKALISALTLVDDIHVKDRYIFPCLFGFFAIFCVVFACSMAYFLKFSCVPLTEEISPFWKAEVYKSAFADPWNGQYVCQSSFTTNFFACLKSTEATIPPSYTPNPTEVPTMMPSDSPALEPTYAPFHDDDYDVNKRLATQCIQFCRLPEVTCEEFYDHLHYQSACDKVLFNRNNTFITENSMTPCSNWTTCDVVGQQAINARSLIKLLLFNTRQYTIYFQILVAACVVLYIIVSTKGWRALFIKDTWVAVLEKATTAKDPKPKKERKPSVDDSGLPKYLTEGASEVKPSVPNTSAVVASPLQSPPVRGDTWSNDAM